MDIEKLKKNKSAMQLLEFNHEFFSTLLVTFLLLLLVETVWEKSVSTFMNINYFLIIVIVSGAISVLTRTEGEKMEKVNSTKKDYLYIGTLGIAGALIVWYKIKDIGMLAYLISIVAGVLIILLSLLLFEEDEKDG